MLKVLVLQDMPLYPYRIYAYNELAAWGSFLFGGVTIGKNVVLGANSLVNKDVPDNAIVAGAPAKILCYRDDV